MYLPQSVTLSETVTNKFRTIKSHTGIPNNVLARIALSLALESGEDPQQANRGDGKGQTLDRDLLFGDLTEIYEALLRQFVENQDNLGSTISTLIECGAHKMGHVRSLRDLTQLQVRH